MLSGTREESVASEDVNSSVTLMKETKMLMRVALTSLLFTLLFQSQAEAIKQLVRMSPPIKSDGFVFETKSIEDGKTRVIIKRNLAEVREPANKNLHIVRGATLQVRGEKGSVVTVSVAPREDKDGWLVYRFDLDSDYLPYSRFTLSEIDDSKRGTGYIGGGTIYECSLTEGGGSEAELQLLIESIETPETRCKRNRETASRVLPVEKK